MRITVREVVLDCPTVHVPALLDLVHTLTGLVGEPGNLVNPLVVNPRGVDLGVQPVADHVVACPAPARLELTGARAALVTDDASGLEIVVVADPALAAMPDPGPARVSGVRLRTVDPQGLAAFWARVLTTGVHGTTVQTPGFAIVCEHDPAYTAPTWPTQARGQSLHLDLRCDDVGAATAHALGCGATLLDDTINDGEGRVLADPAGHPFCLSTIPASPTA